MYSTYEMIVPYHCTQCKDGTNVLCYNAGTFVSEDAMMALHRPLAHIWRRRLTQVVVVWCALWAMSTSLICIVHCMWHASNRDDPARTLYVCDEMQSTHNVPLLAPTHALPLTVLLGVEWRVVGVRVFWWRSVFTPSPHHRLVGHVVRVPTPPPQSWLSAG